VNNLLFFCLWNGSILILDFSYNFFISFTIFCACRRFCCFFSNCFIIWSFLNWRVSKSRRLWLIIIQCTTISIRIHFTFNIRTCYIRIWIRAWIIIWIIATSSWRRMIWASIIICWWNILGRKRITNPKSYTIL
jgi:hypothetical protein